MQAVTLRIEIMLIQTRSNLSTQNIKLNNNRCLYKSCSSYSIDHFSTSNPKHILKTDILETGMVDHYFVYGIRKVNA